MSRFIYITNARMPTEKAHGIQIARMCEAFAAAGAHLELIIPARNKTDAQKTFEFYGIQQNFSIRTLPCIDLVKEVPFLGYWLQLITFTLSVFVDCIFASRKDTLYTREFILAVMLRTIGFDVVYEAHRVLLKKGLFFSLLKDVSHIVTNSQGVANEFRLQGFSQVLPLPNGINLAEFDISASKTELRKEFGWAPEERIALYTGYLYEWKGIKTLLEVGKIAQSFRLVIVGGSAADVEKYSAEARNLGIDNSKLEFVGHKDRKLMPRYMKAADVLLLPNSAVSEESVKYTSPIKMFEYMASRVPIVASDLPSLREVLNEKNAVLVRADDAQTLVTGINKVLNDSTLAQNITEQAYQDVSKLTWDSRAKKILDFIGE